MCYKCLEVVCPQKKAKVYTIRTLPQSLHFFLWNAKESHISAMATVIKKFRLTALFRKALGSIYEI